MVSLLALALVSFAAPGAPAQEGRSVKAAFAEQAPRLDCRLDDAIWSTAAVLGPFRQTKPKDDGVPTYRTVTRIAYTKDALHLAFEVDDDPGSIRATLAPRDGIANEDTLAVYLDTFHDRRRSYVLMVNALGVQQDGIQVEGRETDFSVDLIFRSAGCVTATGYAVEVSIPFESLRYEVGPDRSWGLHVIRQIQRLGEENSWMPLRRDSTSVDGTSGRQLRSRFLSQAGELLGLEHAAHVPRIEAIPVVSGANPSDADGRLSLGGTARVSLTPAMSLDAAVNPDFAEVEADAPQSTANQRFPLFYAEKRPFFLEGAELLTTPIRAFHSRTIVDPDVAAKLSVVRGRTNVTALAALDPARGRVSSATDSQSAGRKAMSGVVRVRRDVGLDSSVGLLATTWNFAGQDNEVGGLDGRLAFGPRTTWTFQALGSTVSERATSTAVTSRRAGFGYSSELSRTGRKLSLQLTGDGFSPDYRAMLGYTQRVNTHRWSVIARYDGRPSSGALTAWSLVNTTLAQVDWKGRAQYGFVYPRLLLSFKRQTYLNLSAYRDYVRVFEEEFGSARTATEQGAFLGAPVRSSWYHGFTLDAGTSPSQKFSAAAVFDQSWNNLDFDQGAGRFARVSPAALLDPEARLDPGRADSRYASLSFSVQPTDAVKLSSSLERSRLTRIDTGRDVFLQHIWSNRAMVSFSRFLWVRGRLDYDSLDGSVFHQVVLAWTPRPGRAVYAGYDETGEWLEREISARPRPERYQRRGRTLFVKVGWSFITRLK
ncbi:MAG: sugar-binding protein [Vicinamibacteria bacterium]